MARMRAGTQRSDHRNRPLCFERLEDRLQLSVTVEAASIADMPSSTAAGSSSAHGQTLSADGRYLAFVSNAPNLKSNVVVTGGSNVYRFDRVTGESVLVSVSADGLNGSNGTVRDVRISADGATIGFLSTATNLHPLDLDASEDVFVRNMASGTTYLASLNAAGDASANQPCDQLVMSTDGGVIAFVTISTNLSPLDNNSFPDVYAHNLSAGTTQLVSVNSLGTAAGNWASSYVSISADGRVVAFASGSSDLSSADTDDEWDVFVHELQSGETELISVRGAGSKEQNSGSYHPKLNADGTVVAFDSWNSRIHPLDNNLTRDVFVRDRIAGVTQLVSVNVLGTGSASAVTALEGISDDGNVVLFSGTSNNLHPLANSSNHTQLFARVIDTASTHLVSVNVAGNASGNGDTDFGSLSADGHTVIFTSLASNLTSLQDANMSNDAFVHDLATGATRLLSRSSAGIGAAAGGSVSDLSTSGDVVAFLSSGDIVDIYDTNLTEDMFVTDLTTQETLLVSRSNPDLPERTGNDRSVINHPGDGAKTNSVTSSDGRYVVFVSYATNLISTPAIVHDRFRMNVFRYDRLSGDVLLVSTDSTGMVYGDRASYDPVISGDGNVIAFTSEASNLIAGRTVSGASAHVYVRYVTEGITICASSLPNQLPNGRSSSPSISADGRLVAFESTSKWLSPLDADSKSDIYLRDLATGDIQLISVNVSGTGSGNDSAFWAQISADGSTVVYSSYASDLHPLDTDKDSDIFARRLATGTTELVSINSSGTGSGNRASSGKSISADGTRIVFRSLSSDLHSPDNSLDLDLFMRDLVTGTTTLVTINENGDGGVDSDSTSVGTISADGSRIAYLSSGTNLHHLAHEPGSKLFVRDVREDVTYYLGPAFQSGGVSLNADGSVVAFAGTERRSPIDTNDFSDVYIIEVTTGKIQMASRHFGNDSAANGESYLPLVSASGEYVVFYSDASDLVDRDWNKKADVFLARVIWDLPELAGDYNLDSHVDAADFPVWRDALGTTGLAPYSGADGDGDGVVDQDDYLVWKANFGRSLPVGGGAAEIADSSEPVAVSAALLEADDVESVGELPVPNPIAARQADRLSGALFLAMPELPRRPALEFGRNARSIDDGRTSDAALVAWCRRNQGVVTRSETKPLARASDSVADEVDELLTDCFDSVFEGFGRLL